MTEKLAIIFPGQGSQSVGMLKEFAHEAIILETFQEASNSLNYDLWSLVQQGPEEQLNQTEYTQPALLTSSVALWRLAQSRQPQTPAFLAGHSLGEYTALVCAEALDFTAAVSLVQLRGRLMQQAVEQGQGAMAAIIGLDTEAVTRLCQDSANGQVLEPANFNAMGQIVIAGQAEAVERAIQNAKAAGAKMAVKLPVSVPSHCRLMKHAAEALEASLNEIPLNKPHISVVNNVDAACYEDPIKIRSALVRQLYSPVRWVEVIQFMVQSGVKTFIECGPGKVLAGLNKRIDSSVTTQPIQP
ncbi:MAG: ACP S-malonyltransferase [Gammaproteobacteria bacterium]